MKHQFQAFGFKIFNQSDNAIDIYIDGTIVDAETQDMWAKWFGDETSVSYKSFRDQVLASQANTFNVYINSYGGIVTDAMAIHDLLVDLQNKGKTVNTIGRGIIASAATYVLMAGKNSEMSKNSWFMIHNVSGGIYGDVTMIENYAASLRKFNNLIRDFYANATGKRKEEITKMMDAETWMTADEAKTNGFVKQIGGDATFTNSIPQEHWKFSNTAVLNAYNAAVQKPATPDQNSLITNQLEEMKKFFQDLGSSIMNAIKGVKPAEDGNQEALINSIAEAAQKPFENVAEQFETTVSEQVTNAVNEALKGEAFTTAVANAVAEAMKTVNVPDPETINNLTNKVTNLEKKNTELEKKNKDLEKDITNLKGKPAGNEGDDPNAPKPIGGFRK